MGFDTETTGLNPEEDSIVGYSFAFNGKDAYYVPVNHVNLSLGDQALDIIYEIMTKCALVLMYNARFDIRALNNSIREATNGKIKYFFPYGVEVWDTLKMARQILGNMPTYHKFCEENGFMTKHTKPRPRYTAEVIYRFIKKDLSFNEAHTGLRDVEIETEILNYLVRQHKKMDKVLYHAPNEA